VTPEERAKLRLKLEQQLGARNLPAATPDHPGRFTPPPGADTDLVQRFRAELAALGGAVHEATGLDAVLQIVQPLIDAQPERRVLAWDDRWLPVGGLAAALTASGVTVDRQLADDLASPARRADLASAGVGLTGAEAGLAETGSIVLVSGPGRGRLPSLLPPIHVALLARRALVGSLSAFLAARPDLVTAGSNYVCITGPSRTADIEHTLSRGVHGPREVHVVLIDVPVSDLNPGIG
jgi:L-lactate dehydrogenase complex protein LldG